MNREVKMYHDPVLLQSAVEGLAIKPDGFYADVTFGGGGHSRAILAQLDSGRLFAFDQDADAAGNVTDDERITFLNHNFRFMTNFLRLHNALPLDGILADLGVSSHQLDIAERGFSTRLNGALDMRMNRSLSVNAGKVINQYSEEQLITVFSEYGEIKNSKKLANTIINKRQVKEIASIDEFKSAIEGCVIKPNENQYYARVFQAIRIEVNDEIGALKELLNQSANVLCSGGRMVIISYHSLEDRLVKNYFRAGNFLGEVEKDFYGNPRVPYKVITTKAIRPSQHEISANSRARSARLRIAEKI